MGTPPFFSRIETLSKSAGDVALRIRSKLAPDPLASESSACHERVMSVLSPGALAGCGQMRVAVSDLLRLTAPGLSLSKYTFGNDSAQRCNIWGGWECMTHSHVTGPDPVAVRRFLGCATCWGQQYLVLGSSQPCFKGAHSKHHKPTRFAPAESWAMHNLSDLILPVRVSIADRRPTSETAERRVHPGRYSKRNYA